MKFIKHFQFGLLQIAIILSINCNAQEYMPINFSNGVWMEECFVKGGYTEKIQKFCSGDTAIDSNLYYKLFETKIIYNPPGYYPDTVKNKFLGLIGNFPDKTVKYIPKNEVNPISIYDFNLNIGDTIQGPHDMFIIREIDSIQICGSYHKRYSQYEGVIYGDASLIEGIGYSNGLLGYNEVFDTGGESYHMLECYSEWSNPECAECDYINKIVEQEQNFLIYPNPFFDRLIIQSSKPVIQIKIHNLFGNEVYSENFLFDFNKVLELNHLIPGFYILRVQHIDGSYYSLFIQKN